MKKNNCDFFSQNSDSHLRVNIWQYFFSELWVYILCLDLKINFISQYFFLWILNSEFTSWNLVFYISKKDHCDFVSQNSAFFLLQVYISQLRIISCNSAFISGTSEKGRIAREQLLKFFFFFIHDENKLIWSKYILILIKNYLRKSLNLVSIAYQRFFFFLLGWRLKVPQLFSTFIDSLRLKLWFFIVF